MPDAHSIRAVECFLAATYRVQTPILLRQSTPLQEYGRLSYCSVSTITGFPSVIWVQKDADHNTKRFCIAHELYHVLMAVASSSSETIERTRLVEDCCDLFANTLCQKHDDYHRHPDTPAKLRFEGLPLRSTVSEN